MRSGVARVGLLAAALVGCGAPAANDGAAREAQPIAGGTFDEEHLAVFQEYTRWGGGISSCTATLLSPTVLLTARHCVAHGDSDNVRCGTSVFGEAVNGSATVVTNDSVPGSNKSHYYYGLDVRVPGESDSMCGYDVALIILSSPIPPERATPAIPRIDRGVERGEPYVAVGYGVDEAGQPNPGRMELGDLGVRCLSDECEQSFGVMPTEFLGDTGVCSGDSGGPALDADGKVIGVASRGSDPCKTPIYGQVAPWRDLITSTVLDAAEAGGYRAPFWAYSGSSDLPEGLAEEGAPCADSSECFPGNACFFDRDPSQATCVPVCANDAQCGAGRVCRTGYDVTGGGLCFDIPEPATEEPGGGLPGPGADDSCSTTPRAPNGVPAPLVALSALLALGLLRRRAVFRANRPRCAS